MTPLGAQLRGDASCISGIGDLADSTVEVDRSVAIRLGGCITVVAILHIANVLVLALLI